MGRSTTISLKIRLRGRQPTDRPTTSGDDNASIATSRRMRRVKGATAG
jgi:hypothetical protein